MNGETAGENSGVLVPSSLCSYSQEGSLELLGGSGGCISNMGEAGGPWGAGVGDGGASHLPVPLAPARSLRLVWL